MKKRIFAVIVFICSITTVITGICSSIIYYNFYVEEAKDQLKTIASLVIYDKEKFNDYNDFSELVNNISQTIKYSLRVSVIKIDGSVMYDNFADYTVLNNHLDRPEIEYAIKYGSGENLRHSNSLNKDTYYYAVKISNDIVIRFAREMDSMENVFNDIMPVILVVITFIIILSFVMASKLTKKIIKPVKLLTETLDDIHEEKNIDNSRIMIYEELMPFEDKIRQQKIKINEYISQLKTEHDTISIITQNMQEGLILLNSNKDILSINHSAKRMLNKKDISFLDKNILQLTRNDNILNYIDISMSERRHRTFDIKDDDKYYRYFLNPVTNNNNNDNSGKEEIVSGLLILIEDITNQRLAEIIRQEFSANVSHELKTPLTTMIGFAEMMGEGLITDNESIKKYSNMINKEGKRLITLIEDIIRLSEIEESFEDLKSGEIDLKTVGYEVFKLLQPRADSKFVRLNFKGQSVKIKANNNYINELLYNLVDNAIKYNKPNGAVTLNINNIDKKAVVSVKDTGVGIGKLHHERIFERFYRVDKSRSKETGGTGLGLSIVKHITELYGGVIELYSEENVGTEIRISFDQNNLINNNILDK